MTRNASHREVFITVQYYDRESRSRRLYRTKVVKSDRYGERVLAKDRDGEYVWFVPDYPRYYIAETDARLMAHG